MPDSNDSKPIAILGEPTRLSESPIWRLQREYYDTSGVAAWNNGPVPHHITNNPCLAAGYAKVLAGYLRDLQAAGSVDESHPLYILEIGAGVGRHAFLLLKALQPLRAVPALKNLKLVYVMADFTESNLSFFREHAQFQDYQDRGELDFALFDAEASQELRLEHSGRSLPDEHNPNPVVVIANYVFDSLTQDVFRIEAGRLIESLAIPVGSNGVTDLAHPGALKHLDIQFEHRELNDPRYYQRPEWDRLLRTYAESLEDTSLCLPVGAFRCIDHLEKIAGGRLLVLAADKAWTRLDELSGLEDPELVLHGSFSMTVNFHALGLLFENRGGKAFHSELRETDLEVSAFLLDERTPQTPEYALAFREAINGFGPLDAFNLGEALADDLESPRLQVCLDLLRMSGWDPEVLYELSEPLADQAEDASEDVQRVVQRACSRVWDNHFHIGGDQDVAFELGRIHYRMDSYLGALAYYQVSLDLHGDDRLNYHNMGLCYYYMKRLGDAHSKFRQALEVDPDYSPSREWCLRIEAELMTAPRTGSEVLLIGNLLADIDTD